MAVGTVELEVNGVPPVADAVPPFPVRRFTVDEDYRMLQAGVFQSGDPYELLEGWIVRKMPHNPPHDGTIELVDDQIRPRLPAGWRLRIQSAVDTADSAPEPDLAVVRGTAGSYVKKHPVPGDVALIVEVSDTTLDRDR